MPWITVIDRDHVQTRVDGELETFSRDDVYSKRFGSGLAHFGPVYGDWRAIQDIADDIAAAFREIDR
jgi:hypothetical protein